MKKQNKGITLIALVITIIVLLILAAVTISTLTGDNGILTQANSAKQRNNQSKAEEEVKLAIGNLQIEERQKNINKNEKVNILEQELKSLYSEQKPQTTVNTSEKGFLINHRGYEFQIDDNYNISYKEPFNAEEWDKTASNEDCFIWGSNTPGKEGYNVVVGYTDKIGNNPKLVFPSRCKKINLRTSEYENNGDDSSRSFCSKVEIVELPNTVTEIGTYAFASSNLTTGFDELKSITIPNSVTKIGDGAFWFCTELTEIIVPNSVTIIGGSAFAGCTNLTSIEIPDSLTSISDSVFDDTAWYNNQPDGLVYAGKVAYKYKGDMPENTTIELKEGTKAISGHAFENCANLISIKIPDSVTSIEKWTFGSCTSLSSIEIPDSVTSIGDYAFFNCTSLTSIEIPDSVTNISYGVFLSCISLTSIEIPDSVTSIGGCAFDNTAWYNSQSDGLVYAGKVAYTYKGKMPENTTIELKKETKGIARDAFYGCSNLTSVTMSKNIEYIGEAAFANCTNLKNIIIWKSVNELGYRTFDGWKDSQIVNIEANEIPDGWDDNWNYKCNAKIVYGYTGE